jgi:hypothetical protein
MAPPPQQVPRAAPPRQPQPGQQHKPWYSEPTVLGTIFVLVVVAGLFIVLIFQILGSGS